MDALLNLFADNSVTGAWPYSVRLLIAAAIAGACALALISILGIVVVWFERKISAHMQGRLGPMYVGGFHGWLQTVADGVKLMLKEDTRTLQADRVLFLAGPVLVFLGSLLSYAALPLSPVAVAANMNVALFYILATSSLVAIGTIMAGYSSYNKWALYGSMRSAAQFISYEVAVALHVLPAILLAGTLNLGGIVEGQASYGILSWYMFRNPFLFVSFLAYYVASLAETGRTPFDLPETESELVAGYHVEYSGMKFALFFMAEYADMFIDGALGTLVFCGGWYGVLPGTPLLVRIFGEQLGFLLNFFIKVSIFTFITIQLRWTLPRFRIDQLMSVCWKFIIPAGLVCTLGSALWHAILRNYNWILW